MSRRLPKFWLAAGLQATVECAGTSLNVASAMVVTELTRSTSIRRQSSASSGIERLPYVSIFSGGMGLDLGLEAAGFTPYFAADNDPAAVQTIRTNRPNLKVFDGDIRHLTGKMIFDETGLRQGELKLLAGGPPCQSFSTAGKRLGLQCPDNGPLIFEYVRLLDELRPEAFLLENVKGLLSASVKWRSLPYNNNGKIVDDLHGSLLRELLDRIRSLGYSADYRLMNAADYGVPQIRQRVFVAGFRDGRQPIFPVPTHSSSPGLFGEKWRPISEVLSDLPDGSYCAKFSERKLQYLRKVPPGGNWRNLSLQEQMESMGAAFHAKGGRTGYWRRLSLDQPSPTILTEPQNASTSLCHPVEHRPLSVRECARIQTFPDDWTFVGRGPQQYRLVGNAVPVLLAKAVGSSIAAQLYKPTKVQCA